MKRSYALIMGTYCLLYWGIFQDTLVWIMHSWRHNSFYTHGFVIFFICLGLFLLNGVKIKASIFQPESGLVPGIVFCILVTIGLLLRFHYLIGLSFIAGALCLNRMFLTNEQLGFVQLPFWIMIIVIPVPFLNEVSGYMAYTVSRAVAIMLGALFTSVEVDGISVLIPGGVAFDIGTDCSGASSILALISIAVLWLVSFKDNPKITYALIALTMPIGFITNVLRIVFIFIVATAWGMEYAVRFWHDFAAYIFYSMSLGILFVFWIVIKRFMKDEIRLRKLVME
ncbi:MAG: exosortase/archaeosortase family protein [Nitrospiraceae bacterium]|nr:MAG: exosortase/archaeosortase family protein [Nitrospiraceae bacterium]